MAVPLVRRYLLAAEFRAAAEAFLLEHEAENTLPLGLIPTLERNPDRYGGGQPYFAVAYDGDSVEGVAIMTPPHNVVIAAGSTGPAIKQIARDLFENGPSPPGVMAPTAEGALFVEAWRALTGAGHRITHAERLYRLDEVNAPRPTPGNTRRVDERDRGLLSEWLYEFQKEALGVDSIDEARRTAASMVDAPAVLRGAFLWQDAGSPVCVVGYGRPTANGTAVAPVYTPPMYRGRGYATACTAAVSQYLLDSGRKFCVLFTDLANPTSNKIYQAIGYRPISDFNEIAFTTGLGSF